MTPQEAIITAAAAVHGVSVNRLLSAERSACLRPARQTAAFLMDDIGMNFSAIARSMNRKHCTTASSLIDSVETYMTEERQAQIDAARLVSEHLQKEN